MIGPRALIAMVIFAGLALSGCSEPAVGQVDQGRLLAASSDADNWLSHGRTWDEQRFSPLADVNDANVGELGLAWSVDLDTSRGQEATPIVVDGVMFVSTAWSKVMALDAATGAVLWRYDPEVDGSKGAHACCDVVNRGVAVWEGRVFVGTIDGRLIALDAATGEEDWSVVTVDQAQPYTITGAPRVFDDKVVIGNGGAELGVRGYVTAYDTDTGEQVWRFYTVPGNPADGPDGVASDGAMADLAAATWHGQYWEMGGGGTVWDSIVYDPQFDQLLIGVGNGSPWNHRARSDGEGDNLFLSSIVALDPDTGEYKWHYQANPGETWDFTNTQQITLADLEIDGEVRHVLMQAPKNGFFYVIDRENGALISAEAYAPVNWAERIDLETGRPVEVAAARYADEPFLVFPSGIGAHAWMPMSYSPETGLVYIPAMHVPLTYGDDVDYDRHPGRWNTGVNFQSPPAGAVPGDDAPARRRALTAMTRGMLVAWNPVRQEAAWTVEHDWPWNGGTLATAGNLVFQGDAHGYLRAYRADTGDELWSFGSQRGIVAGPITYRVNGAQYVAVIAGYGGSMGMATPSSFMRHPQPNGVMLAFRIDGAATLAPLPDLAQPPLAQSAETFTAARRSEGERWFMTYCAICHLGPVNPDLQRSAVATDAEAWRSVVIGGTLARTGMASFSDYLSAPQAETVRAYILGEAERAREEVPARS